jgi:predicted nucleotidyltransferase
VTEAELIGEIARRLSEAAPKGSRILLFGSRARGDSDSSSDYDVLVIEPSVDDAIRESVRLRDALRGLVAPIDVLVFSEEVAHRRAVVAGTVVERALREGRELART